eukprot:scaffold5385_cov152-Amphora_coffeaeformis.AAC.5
MPPMILTDMPPSTTLLDSMDTMSSLSMVIKVLEASGRSKLDILTALQTHAERLQRDIKAVTDASLPPSSSATGPDLMIISSPIHDPGLKDCFGTFQEHLQAHQAEAMDNLQRIPNNQGQNHPAADTLFHITAHFRLDDRPRSYALIMEDMQQTYFDWIDYVQPNCEKLLTQFRKLKLPVVWSSWSRRPDDGMHGALDRFYGPQGVVGPDGE